MRLSSFEIETIKKISGKIYKNADIYLFGSRTDDRKKGGDIDLLIETDKNYPLSSKLNFLVQLKNNLGDQKIDVVVYNKNHNKCPLIVSQAKKTGVLL